MDGEVRKAYNEAKMKLDEHYSLAKSLLMHYQSPTTGLFSCGDEANVRDSIYCAAALWALGLAYRRIDDDGGRCYELEHSTLKCMRGILMCYMRQSRNIEKFKTVQNNDNAIHSKFDAWSGDAIPGPYPHLQQDVVALFVLYLVQITSSGLQIIFNTDEVAFVQNLVYYLERSYRVPDYGLWGRGSKYNNGSTELHASAVGAAKAALEAVNGFNLFGKNGAPWSVLWVDMDAHNRNRMVIETLLPKESSSKNTDSAIIPTVGYPFFAVEDTRLCEETKNLARKKLESKHGFKRFVGDGYKTVMEDKHRQYYNPAEIKLFNGFECEWPIFFIYMIIDGVFHEDWDMVDEYQKKLEPLLHNRKGKKVLVPRFYYIPNAEIHKPSPEAKCSSFTLFEEEPVFLWGQALHMISSLLVEKLISRQELDPNRRFIPVEEQRGVSMRYSMFQGVVSDTTIHVVLISESSKLQALLSTYGIQTQTPHQVEPIQIWPSQELVKVYEHLGIQTGLGLSGRPMRPIGVLGTSKIYRILGNTIVCYPLLFDISDFYMAFDTQILLNEIEDTLSFINKYWRMPGRPLFITLLREDITRKGRLEPMLQLLSAFKRGQWKDMKIRLGKMQSFVASTFIEHLEFIRYNGNKIVDPGLFRPFIGLHDEDEDVMNLKRHGSSCSNLQTLLSSDKEMQQIKELENAPPDEIVTSLSSYHSVDVLSRLLSIVIKREGIQYPTKEGTCLESLNRVYRKAANQKKWDVVRYTACLTHKVVDSLAPAITTILAKGRQITLGVFGKEEVSINNPLPPSEIQKILYNTCAPHNEYEACLQQELVLHVATAIIKQTELFEGMLRVRIGWLIHAMKLELLHRAKITEDDVNIYAISPSGIKQLMMDVLNIGKDLSRGLTWLQRRQVNGALNKVPNGFYSKVWSLLVHCSDGFIINNNHLPQQPTVSDMSPSETAWYEHVEEQFAGIRDPEYRQIMVETLMMIGTIVERNPEIIFQTRTNLDIVIDEAFTHYKKENGMETKEKEKEYMESFYELDPTKFGKYICHSVVHTLLQSHVVLNLDSCVVS